MTCSLLPRSSSKKFALLLTMTLAATATWFIGRWESNIAKAFDKTELSGSERKVILKPSPDNYSPSQDQILEEKVTLLQVDDQNVDPKIAQEPSPKFNIASHVGSTFGKEKTLSQADQEELKARLEKATEEKIILVWISGFGAKVVASVDPKICGNCIVTQDRSLLDDERTGAIILHFDALKPGNVPPTRNPNHLYLFWVMESTITVSQSFGAVLKFADELQFNGSYTHRRDADVYSPYGNVASMSETILEGNKMKPEELLKMKTKLGVAIVSNCGLVPGARKRLPLLKELISYGVVEGFGGCLGGRNFADGHRRDATHHNEVKKYKFYFAFENSYHCKGYITEKYFDNALSGFAVPVVWGAMKEDYESISPPGSFIFAEDFASMKELAEYIKYLDQNDEAYLQYLKWITLKPVDLPEYGRETGWCQICRILHGINVDDIYNPNYDPEKPERPLFTDGVAKRTVKPSLTGWFIDQEDPKCFQEGE